MSGRSSRSGLKLRMLAAYLSPVILFAGLICRADDTWGSHNCRDDSKAVSSVDGSGIAGSTEAKLPSVRLFWDAGIPASKRPADAIQGYNIYRREPGKAYEQINLVVIRETSCTDYAVKVGHTYLYQTKAVSMQGTISKPSNQATGTVRSH